MSRDGTWCWACRTDAHASAECEKAKRFAAQRRAQRAKALTMGTTEGGAVTTRRRRRAKAPTTTTAGTARNGRDPVGAVRAILEHELAAADTLAGRLRRALEALKRDLG